MSIVGQDECVARIEEHFRECQNERDILYAEEAIQEFKECWDTLVNALFCQAEERTPYQRSTVEDGEDVSVEL